GTRSPLLDIRSSPSRARGPGARTRRRRLGYHLRTFATGRPPGLCEPTTGGRTAASALSLLDPGASLPSVPRSGIYPSLPGRELRPAVFRGKRRALRAAVSTANLYEPVGFTNLLLSLG